jgi:hypothetical protein
LASQVDDVGGQSRLVVAASRRLSLGRAMLAERAAGPALGNAKGLTQVTDASAATRRAQKFPFAAS